VFLIGRVAINISAVLLNSARKRKMQNALPASDDGVKRDDNAE
jgi:hypothetical protein